MDGTYLTFSKVRGLGLSLPQLEPARLIVLLWCVVAILNIALSLVGGFDPLATLKVTITSLCGALLSLTAYAATRRIVGRGSRFALSFVVGLAIANGSGLWIIDVLVQTWTGAHGGAWSWPYDYFFRLRYNWVYFTILFLLQAAVSALLNSARTLLTREQQLVEARLATLRFQLNPHFLFNTLNAIETLVAEAGATEAEEMITRLSDFLRASLSEEPTGLVSLSYELDTIQAYLDIESIRFGDRMAVHYACDSGLADTQVPSLILQPLVENAIKYAVAPSKEKVTLLIEARATGDDLVLVVEDNGMHQSAARAAISTGVGLRNVAARLDALYGSAGRMEAIKRERGFTAVIHLPLRRADS